jgi:ribosome biogenesis GTP-binding protein YsxC/EngB
MKTFSDAVFLAAAGRPAEFPPAGDPEVVFAGRSNVGKSSAINALLGRRRLAFTSKTPGRTQTINFYEAGEGWRLVDLPGYGFARVPKPLQAKWGELVTAYLGAARPIAALVVVMDARHPFTPLDRQLLGWLGVDTRTLSSCCQRPTSSAARSKPRRCEKRAQHRRQQSSCSRARLARAWRNAATCWSIGSSRSPEIKSPR